MSTPEAPALSGRASDPSRDRGRAWYRSTGREVTVSSIPGPLTGSASVARLASWGERLRAWQPVKVKAFQAQFRKGFGNLIFRPVHSGLKLDTLLIPKKSEIGTGGVVHAWVGQIVLKCDVFKT